MSEPSPTAEAAHRLVRVPHWLPETWRSTRAIASASIWLAVVLAFALLLSETLRFDFRTKPLVGDQASFLLQGLSLAFDGHDLSYDRADLERWRAVDWTNNPGSLFFQKTEDGWAFAKPYGYSGFLAPFIAALGAARGVAVANSLLFLLLIVVSGAILRTHLSGPVVPLMLAAFYIAGFPYFYAYTMHSDLFLAVVTATALFLFLKYWQTRSLLSGVGAATVMSFAVVEKLSMAALLLPVGIVLLCAARSLRQRALVMLAGAATLAVAALPYLHYSDYETWNPYTGERYFASGLPPFGGGSSSGQVHSDEIFSVSYVVNEITRDPLDKLESLAYYFVGRHTGMLAFLPVTFIILVATVITAYRLDRRGVALLLGLAGYVAFYVVLFTGNYYGGGSSLGNRYFLQVSPFVLALAAVAPLGRRFLTGVAIAGVVLGTLFLLPHHRDPDDAFRRLDRVSLLQSVLPFESNQTWATYFRDPPPGFPPNRVAPARDTGYQLVRSGEREYFADVAGNSIPVRTGWVNGNVDSIHWRPASVSVSGWAARVVAGEPLEGILVVYDGSVWAGASSVPRSDVVDYFQDERLRDSGFRLDVLRSSNDLSNALDNPIRVFGIVGGVASELPIHVQG